MENTLKVKVFTVSKNRLKKDLKIIKDESYFPHHDFNIHDRATVEEVEKIAKSLSMQTVFIFDRPNLIRCHLTW